MEEIDTFNRLKYKIEIDQDDGFIYYYNHEGLLHRENGPAAIGPDGRHEWYLNGERHRVGGPAYMLPTGTKEWWLNGVLHRDDWPAAIYPMV